MKQSKIFHHVTLKACFAAIILCVFGALIATEKPTKTIAPQITIWVHGTLFFFRSFVPKFLYIQKGIAPLSSFNEKHYYRSTFQELEQQDKARFSCNHVYLFGWSGKLSYKKRFKAANQLNEQLKLLVREYQKNYDKKPFIRIITHSHGGNVALNLAACQEAPEIDELILLACPVQEKTATLVESSCFKKVVSLFSQQDFVQILDPQGLHSWQKPFFSQRAFRPGKNVQQAHITLNGKHPFHVDFMLKRFLKHLPYILDLLEKQETTDTGLLEGPLQIAI